MKSILKKLPRKLGRMITGYSNYRDIKIGGTANNIALMLFKHEGDFFRRFKMEKVHYYLVKKITYDSESWG